jgi:phosphopantetheinyl transferase (holo-ACP synthase)
MPRKIDGIDIIEVNRFSEYIKPKDKDGMTALTRWQEWFKSRNIQSVISLTDKGFALYREGMIDITDEIE